MLTVMARMNTRPPDCFGRLPTFRPINHEERREKMLATPWAILENRFGDRPAKSFTSPYMRKNDVRIETPVMTWEPMRKMGCTT
jgi:hypothetical protein